MAENNSKNVDVRPKTSRSRSADRKDGYVWSGKKLSWSKKSESCSESEAIGTVENVEIPLRSQERQLSCSSIELDLDHSCGHRFLGRSLKQKLQDAVGQCFPIKNCSGRHSPGLPSKRKIHISELMLDKCPFPPRSDLAFRWHFIKRHTVPMSPNSDEWVSADLSERKLRDAQLKRRNTEDDIPCFSHTNGQPCVITANSASCTGGHITGSMMNLVTNNSIEDSDMDSEDEIITLCTSSRKRNKPRWEMEEEILQLEAPPKFHTQIATSTALFQTSFRSVTIRATGVSWTNMQPKLCWKESQRAPFYFEIQRRKIIYSLLVLDATVVLFMLELSSGIITLALMPMILVSSILLILLGSWNTIRTPVPVCSLSRSCPLP
uniref:SOCS4/SOCS5 domain-containing protein n=1 Tax=Mus musculus TaxID=10090 RepID=Q8C1K3_MOUSE|nr:unnamed protein product [Mus musculus]